MRNIALDQSIDTDDLMRWRAMKEESLRAEDGWLTLIGLFWLEPGEQAFGASDDCPIQLPAGKAPARAGSFTLQGQQVLLRAELGAGMLLDGAPVGAEPVPVATGRKPALVTLGDITMFVIERGGRFAIRARDRQHPARAAFAGREWFAPDPSWRITAEFTPHEPPRTLPIMNIVGIAEETPNPGTVSFTLDGQEYRFEALGARDGLFIIFRDATNGAGSYPAGRFIDAPAPEDGRVMLDFNCAYSPPCAFTDFATCPLPPPQNRLPLRVEAGERYQGQH